MSPMSPNYSVQDGKATNVYEPKPLPTQSRTPRKHKAKAKRPAKTFGRSK